MAVILQKITKKMTSQKTALILDHLDRGTILTTLQTNNYYRTLKFLNTSVKNWESICDILEEDKINEIIVLGKFTENTLFRMCLPEYKVVVQRFTELIKKKKHLFFIYKSNLFGDFSYLNTTIDDRESNFLDESSEETYYFNDSTLKSWLYFKNIKETESEYINKVKEFIKKLNIEFNILPYEKLVDIEISGQIFIENISEGLIFKIYVPNDRIWSNEFDKFIILFRDYASSVANEELKIIQNRTDSGTICSLYSLNKNIEEERVNDLYKEFTSFMDLCSSNSNEAIEIINKLNIDQVNKEKIIKKYIKESQRLLLDIKQERELKLITIKHRLQNELQEAEITNELLNYIDNSIPNSESKNIFLGSQVIQNQNIFINSQIIDKVDGIVCNELNGNINFKPEEQELLKLIEKYSENITNATELKTALYELKDSASSKESKRNGWQKIYGFLGKVGDKVGDVGVALLTKYIEQQMNI